MKKFYVSLASLTVLLSGILLFNFMGGISNAAGLPRNCDNNSIIYCGGVTSSELTQRYNENKTGDLPAIYQAYGLSAYEMTHADTAAKMGEVHKDGTVTVNGEIVATEATSIGRQNIASGSTVKSIAGKAFYDSPPSRSFARESIVAYVFFDQGGQFKSAVLTACGNAVSAHPKPKPQPPKPQPQPKSECGCNNLTVNKLSSTSYNFVASASASGDASIVSYTFDFGDGHNKTSNETTVSHTYDTPGNYTAKLTVNIKIGNTNKTATGPQCEKQVVIETPPPTPVFTCDSLTQNKISRTDYSFEGKATAEGGATIVGYTFDFGDGNQQVVTNPTSVTHTYTKDGPYTAKLSVTVKVNGQNTTVTDVAKCVAPLTIVPPEECKAGIPVGDTRCNECKPGVPTGDERCTPCTIPGKEQFPKNSSECAETPIELPHTGPMDVVGGSVGLGSMIAAASYWYASRRGLLAELLKR